MALNEVSFYNTNGDEVSISNIVNQMINYYQMKLEVGETAVTDFNEGSEIRNLLEAFAVGIYALLEEQHEATQIAFIQTSYGMWLDKIGELPFINLPRIEGEPALGNVTFTLAEAQESDFTIPSGTIVSDPVNEVEFETLADATILEGELTVSVNVQSLESGLEGNIPAHHVTDIDDYSQDSTVDTDLLSVDNEEAFYGGSDYETDDDYRERLLANVQADGFGTQGWYENICENVDGVHDVLLVDAEGYTKKVLVNGFSKPVSDSVLLDVLSELTLTDNIVLGHRFTIDKPVYTPVELEVTLDVVTLFDEDELSELTYSFFNGGDYDRVEYDGLSIGDSVSREDLVGLFLVYADVVDVVSITCDGVEVSTLEPASSSGVLCLSGVSFVQNEV